MRPFIWDVASFRGADVLAGALGSGVRSCHHASIRETASCSANHWRMIDVMSAGEVGAGAAGGPVGCSQLGEPTPPIGAVAATGASKATKNSAPHSVIDAWLMRFSLSWQVGGDAPGS